jgi:hypothetical protein
MRAELLGLLYFLLLPLPADANRRPLYLLAFSEAFRRGIRALIDDAVGSTRERLTTNATNGSLGAFEPKESDDGSSKARKREGEHAEGQSVRLDCAGQIISVASPSAYRRA